MTLSAGPAEASSPVGIPLHLTRFIGRDEELASLVRLLGSVRLLTLTGAGGSGKTRLAREAVLRQSGDFTQVGWTDLAPIGEAGSLAQQVAAALKAGERADASPRDQIVEAVAERPVLLVLDNCEHLVDACAELVESLLRVCPRLTILATSREALSVESETAWLVPPLAPDEATELFADRARAALPSFQLSPANAKPIEEICRRLDGIPLAIELAAARVRVLSPEQIARRLDDAFRLLVGRSRTALPRHRTLRATMEWSFDLLAPREQILLRRLSVFAGSFTLDAVEDVCAGEPLEVDDILDAVATLVDKSLVVMSPGEDEARYHLLETVRQYAVERMDEANERDCFECRFAEYYLRLLEQSEPALIGGFNDPRVLAAAVAELDNLRAAAYWSTCDPSRAELALRFVGAGFWLCYAVGMFREMRLVADRALGLGHGAGAHVRGRALLASALTALAQGEYERSWTDFEAALPLLREVGDERATAVALAKHGATRMLGGQLERAIPILNEALAFTAGWPPHDIPVVFARFWRAWAAYQEGDFDTACALMAANRVAGRDAELPVTYAHATAALARFEMARGDAELGARLAREALGAEAEIGDGWGIALALDVMADVAARKGLPEVALRLLAGTESHRRRIALALPGPAPMDRERILAQLRDELGEGFERLHRAGLALTSDEIVRLALVEVDVGAGPEGDGTAARVQAAAADRIPAATPDRVPLAGRPATPRLQVLALGALQVFVDGRMVEPSAWGSARPRELLVHLLMHPEGRTKEQVGLAFWPDASPAQLRNNFHVTLHRLRKALGGSDWVELVGDRYVMDRSRVTVDAAEFEREVLEARRALKRQAEDATEGLEAALAQYRGDFLDGEPAGDWHLEHRDHLQKLYSDALLTLAEHHTREGRHERAAQAYRRVLARDELNEGALRALVAALMEAGERSQALRSYQRFTERLRKELDAEPEPATVRLVEGLLGVGSAR